MVQFMQKNSPVDTCSHTHIANAKATEFFDKLNWTETEVNDDGKQCGRQITLNTRCKFTKTSICKNNASF